MCLNQLHSVACFVTRRGFECLDDIIPVIPTFFLQHKAQTWKNNFSLKICWVVCILFESVMINVHFHESITTQSSNQTAWVIYLHFFKCSEHYLKCIFLSFDVLSLSVPDSIVSDLGRKSWRITFWRFFTTNSEGEAFPIHSYSQSYKCVCALPPPVVKEFEKGAFVLSQAEWIFGSWAYIREWIPGAWMGAIWIGRMGNGIQGPEGMKEGGKQGVGMLGPIGWALITKNW